MTPAATNATPGRGVTAEDLFALRIVSDPRLSPDGTTVAYVVTRLDKESDSYKAAIWLVPVSGGEPRQLTSGNARDTNPRWSPDGKRLLFVSNRSGLAPLDTNGEPVESKNGKSPNQLWTIAIDGGEAIQLTRLEAGASAPEWSPDGRSIAFLSGTKPAGESGVPESPHKQIADERIITRLTYRFDGRGFLERYQHLFTIPASGGDPVQLTFGDMDDGGFAWAPDGRSIAFLSNRLPDRELNRVTLVYSVPVAGGETRCLTPGAYDFDAISWSPDGTTLAMIGTDDPQAGGAKNNHLWTMPAAGGTPQNHSRDWDRSLGDHGMSDVFMGSDQRPVWSADGTTIACLVSDCGTTHYYRFTPGASGNPVQITEGPRRVIAVTGGDTVAPLVLASGDAAHPFELFVREQGRERALTRHNAGFLSEIELVPAEEITFLSAAGDREIQGWVMKPVGYRDGVKYPLIVQIHGGPHAMYGQAMFHEMQLMAARGYVVLFTNPRGSSGYGEEFSICTRNRWGESDMPDVMGGVDALLQRGFVDEARIGVTGGSYGGYLTNWIIGHTNRFKAAVTQRCVSNFYSMIGTSDIGPTFGVYEMGGLPWADTETVLAYSPISYVADMQTPLLIVHSEQDLRCPIEQAEQLYSFLKMLGREVAFVRIPGEDHNLSRTGTPSRRLARLHHLIGWFDSHL